MTPTDKASGEQMPWAKAYAWCDEYDSEGGPRSELNIGDHHYSEDDLFPGGWSEKKCSCGKVISRRSRVLHFNGRFIPESEARELWEMKNCWRTSEERNRKQGLENDRLRKRLAAFEEAAKEWLDKPHVPEYDGRNEFIKCEHCISFRAKLRAALEGKP